MTTPPTQEEVRMRYEQDRIDGTMLSELSGHYSGGPFRFRVPPECLDGEARGGTDETPGIYLNGWGSSSGGPHPYAVTKPLSPVEARELAQFLDRHDPIRFCCDGQDMQNWPHSYVEIVDCFYAALGRRLERAIDASTDRASSLREVRAAITGTVS